MYFESLLSANVISESVISETTRFCRSDITDDDDEQIDVTDKRTFMKAEFVCVQALNVNRQQQN